MTRQQSRMLAFLKSYVGERGFSPSYDEMMAHMGLKSKSGIHRILSALKAQDKIDWNHARARSVELRKQHRVACPHCGGAL